MIFERVSYILYLAMCLIQQTLFSAKNAEKNTQPNAIRLQYIGRLDVICIHAPDNAYGFAVLHDERCISEKNLC